MNHAITLTTPTVRWLLAALLEDPEALAAVLRHHVVAGKMTVAEMLELSEVVTLTANPLAITSDDDSVLIGGARVLEADVLASNGIIHAIDRVLLPPDLDLP